MYGSGDSPPRTRSTISRAVGAPRLAVDVEALGWRVGEMGIQDQAEAEERARGFLETLEQELPQLGRPRAALPHLLPGIETARVVAHVRDLRVGGEADRGVAVVAQVLARQREAVRYEEVRPVRPWVVEHGRVDARQHGGRRLVRPRRLGEEAGELDRALVDQGCESGRRVALVAVDRRVVGAQAVQVQEDHVDRTAPVPGPDRDEHDG